MFCILCLYSLDRNNQLVYHLYCKARFYQYTAFTEGWYHTDMNIKKFTKSLICILTVCALIFSFASCGNPKNVVSEGIKEFGKISDNEVINDENLNITKSEDGASTNYTYIFPAADGNPAILFIANADSKTKELIDVSLSFVGTGRKNGVIPATLKGRFTDLASAAMRAFAGLGEDEAKAILEELRAYDSEFYNGKSSTTKTVGNFRYSLGSSIWTTVFTIKNPAYDTAAESGTAQ